MTRTAPSSQPSPDSFVIKATLLLASTLTVMSGATIAPSLPAMQEHFSAVANSEFWVRLVLTIPALFIVIGSPIAGQIVDKIGRKPLLLGAAVLYGLAGGSGFVLDSIVAILAGRALLGLAVAGVMVSATTLIADYYRGDARANFMGLQAAFMGFGGVLFLSVGGFIADLNWRLPFLIYLFSWLLLPTILLVLYEPSRPVTDASVAVGIPQQPLPIKLLILIYGSVLLQQIAFYLIPVQLPFHLRQVAGVGASQTGIAIACATLFSALTSMRYGKVKRQLSFISILAIAFGLMGLGYIGLGLVSNYWLVLLILVPAGMGLGLMMPNLNVWVSNEVSDTMRGRALGGLTTFMFLGQFLSPIASQPFRQNLGMTTTYGLTGVLLLTLGILIGIFRKQICYLVKSTVGTER
ncbi:Bacillibactin exporter [Halomicronema hongdechloris C2206]|uniref:MFS-type drug efflux transporter P55 n=1 Tax=Halomicronema hongdechloris C2206 TaxID=1641165 RepID=A0A1Z3HM93_9CYAN|nr:MFS transporter [Halomicronema hongdechloris]ASC71395.1 Bacillibactin exporter [Halomicronema hongdechloris C2206]